MILNKASYFPAVEVLITKLDDNDWGVRKTAIEALSNIKDYRAVELLLTELDDDDWLVRKIAIGVLGNIKDSRAVEPLIVKLDDDNFDVRCEALGALAKICRDEVDQKLLSKNFGVGASLFCWLNPKDPITEERVAEAAAKLKLTPKEVRQRYENLAQKFNLTLAW